MFKKCAINSIEMKFEQFDRSLGKLFQEVTREEVKALAKRHKEVKRMYFDWKAFLKQATNEDLGLPPDSLTKPGEVPDADKSDDEGVDENELKTWLDNDREIQALWKERDRIVDQIDAIENTPEEKFKTKAYEHIECHDEAKYRKWIKGFVLPFNTKVKPNNEESERLNKNYRYKKPKNIGQIKEEVKKIKAMWEAGQKVDLKKRDQSYQK